MGKSVLICAAETIDGIDFGKLKHKIVQIPKGWTCRVLQENRNNIWVQSCLLCHGLHVMEGRETKEQSAQMTLDEVIRRFVREFCGVKEGSWINRKSFCEYLCRYNDKCLHGKKIEMGTTQLGQYVENLLCWESEEIRRDKNRRGFKDWHMNIERIDAEIQRAEDCERQAEEPKDDNFEQYIDALSELLAEPNVSWR